MSSNENGTIQGKTLDDMQKIVITWAESKGWYPDPDLTFATMIALLHSEVSEALEAFRKIGMEDYTDRGGKPDDVASELADILIRLLHYCAVLGVDLEHEFDRKMAYNEKRPFRHGGKKL